MFDSRPCPGKDAGGRCTLIDRLEQAGYVQRNDDPQHGRRKLITPAPALLDAITPLLRPAIENGRARLGYYSVPDLRLILDFLQATHDGQSAITEAIRDREASAP